MTAQNTLLDYKLIAPEPETRAIVISERLFGTQYDVRRVSEAFGIKFQRTRAHTCRCPEMMDSTAGVWYLMVEGVAMSSDSWLDLADVVRALRRELAAATAEGSGSEIRFELGPVELEFMVDVKREGGGDAGIRFGVVSFGAKGGVTSGSGHQLKLVLTPQDSSGHPPRISDRVTRIPDQ